jgi:hypothetical protein
MRPRRAAMVLPGDEWRSSAGKYGHMLVDITHWMTIPEIPA